jgi:hypothetical protein
MRGHWAAQLLDPANLDSEAETRAADNAEALCIESNFLQSDQARALVNRFLESGRGVYIMINRLSPASRAFLKELGFEVQESTKPGRSRFQYIFAAHPVLHPFTLPDYGNLMEVEVIDPFTVRANQALPLIFTDKSEPVLMEKTKGSGRLMVQAFAFDRRQTTWPVQVTFLPFLDLCLQKLRPADPVPTVFEPATVMTRVFPTNSPVRAVILKDADGVEQSRAPMEYNRVKLRLPGRPGFYTAVCEGGNEPPHAICVNPSRNESELLYTNHPVSLLSWVIPKAVTKNGVASGPSRATAASIFEERIWWWLLVAALVGLGVEAVIANFKQRTS